MKKKTDDPEVVIDMTLPRSRRPMIGLDIEEWRAELAMPKFDTQHALGFRNSNHYNKICNLELLPFELELLVRLYEDNPVARGWSRYSLVELFNVMYAHDRDVFKGTPHEKHAQVDLGNRFTKLLGRSPARQYSWLKEGPPTATKELKAYAVIECILSKLHQVKNPRETLERVSKMAWALRGVDIDTLYPVPTLQNPPKREPTGRKSNEYKAARDAGGVLPPKKVQSEKKPVSKVTPIRALKKAVAKTAPAKRGKAATPAAKTAKRK